MTWRIYDINYGHCQLTYITRNSENQRIFYCLQQYEQNSVRLMRCTQNGEPQNYAWLKEGVRACDLMEVPTGNSNLEKLCRQWIIKESTK